jgi:hypothetical protein
MEFLNCFVKDFFTFARYEYKISKNIYFPFYSTAKPILFSGSYKSASTYATTTTTIAYK